MQPSKHEPKVRKRFVWGVESPNARKSRLLRILEKPEKQGGRGLKHSEARSQLNEVECFLANKSTKIRRNIMKSHSGESARSTTAIYTLRDPRNGYVRYVGKTERPLNVRLSQHIHASRQSSHYTANWIKSLLVNGLLPIIEEVEVVEFGGDWVEAEQRWIRHYRENGAELTNLGDGGEGNPGFTHRHETRARLSETTSAHMNQPDVKRKHALRMSGFNDSDIKTILFRIVNGETQMSIAADYGVTQNYISRIVTGATFGWMKELDDLRKRAKEATYLNFRKLDAEAARQIVEDYIGAGGKNSFRAIANNYGITYSTVQEIIAGKTWQSVIPKSRILIAQQLAQNCARQKPNPRRKLTRHQVAKILLMHGISSIRSLSREFKVDRQTIKKIVEGQSYRVWE